MTEEQDFERSPKRIARRLRITRSALGYEDQGDFAEAAGVKATTYNQYETGTNRPSLNVAHKLCDRYKLTLDWIYRGNPSALPTNLERAIFALEKTWKD